MNRRAKKRALRIRLTIVYSLMVLAVLLLVAGLYLVVQGYRFNRYDGKIEQGGLVQFNTFPTGADVWLDQSRLANKTQSKLTVSTGKHTVTMKKDGYNAWKKDVTVKAGEILWLDYVRLIPQNLTTKTVAPLAGVGTGRVSYDTKKMAVIERESEPTVSLINLEDDTPEKRQVALPVDSYTAPSDGEQQTFALYTWAYDNRYLLIKHTVGQHIEWISFNTDNTKVAKNLTKVLGIDAVDVQYAKDDANTLLMLTTANEVRKTNIDQKTVSGPLLKNVHDFTMYDTATIVYTTNQDTTTHKRTAGYLTIGTTGPRVVYETPADDSAVLRVSINKYYGKYYQVVAHGEKVMIYTGDLTVSDAKNPEPFTLLATLNAKGATDYIGFSPDQHRFVYAGSGNQIEVYDLDQRSVANITLQVTPQTGLDWVDNFHFATNEDGILRLYNYDGTNGHDMLSGVVAQDVSLLQNGKYLHAITKNGETASVTRVNMLVD